MGCISDYLFPPSPSFSVCLCVCLCLSLSLSLSLRCFNSSRQRWCSYTGVTPKSIMFLVVFCSVLVKILDFSEIQLVCDGPTDRQTDGRTDGQTDKPSYRYS